MLLEFSNFIFISLILQKCVQNYSMFSGNDINPIKGLQKVYKSDIRPKAHFK